MSSMNKRATSFDSVDSVLNFLREPSPSEVVISSTTSTQAGSDTMSNPRKLTRGRKKEKEHSNVMNSIQINSKDVAEILPSGRVRFGPIIVNPRKKASKTLFTGRRSKYEELCPDEEEKRRLRRERNRIAATKCREKRESVLENLEVRYRQELQKHNDLLKTVGELQSTKRQMEGLLANHIEPCRIEQMNQMSSSQEQSTMLYNDMNFPMSSIETCVTNLIPSNQFQPIQNTQESFDDFLHPESLLTNTAYHNNNYSNNLTNMDQQYQQPTITMSSNSFNQLFDGLESTAPCIDKNNNHCSALFNSTSGSSPCAQ